MRRPSGLQALLGFWERCAPQGGPLWTSICLASISQEGLWKQGFRDSAPGLPATRLRASEPSQGCVSAGPRAASPLWAASPPAWNGSPQQPGHSMWGRSLKRKDLRARFSGRISQHLRPHPSSEVLSPPGQDQNENMREEWG